MENKISNTIERIFYFIEIKGLSIREFAKNVGISHSLLRKIKSLGSDKLENIFSIYPELNPTWVMTGKGDMLLSLSSKPVNKAYLDNSLSLCLSPKESNSPDWSDPKWNAEFSAIDTPSTLKEIAVEHIPINILKGREEAYKPIPFVGEAAVAGFGNADFAIKERDVKDYYVIPKFKDSNIDFMIEIHGESMYPTFKSGDVVACTIIRESTFIQWNRVHLIATAEQGILIKRLKRGTTGTTIMLVSDNLDYDPFEVELTSVRGIALVQGLVRLE